MSFTPARQLFWAPAETVCRIIRSVATGIRQAGCSGSLRTESPRVAADESGERLQRLASDTVKDSAFLWTELWDLLIAIEGPLQPYEKTPTPSEVGGSGAKELQQPPALKFEDEKDGPEATGGNKILEEYGIGMTIHPQHSADSKSRAGSIGAFAGTARIV
ncbi:hypothetical protein MGG_00610 [Pyricularia oryzae 70-15]|uniref:Uncharacterized protein n=1 Tax=Pyricularia oryzae (strain 70-15 / ATCC MYA-4617 / FGSC 8958) TaxID=242507 RepID=G4NB75_PYRO7|nr:uncharacterized protein MGG_00610 [Pyricularia oryzae 70-15]EHA48837.1 hypothetical protein MGG_00610 [Pyricularia oryzae 70-15]